MKDNRLLKVLWGIVLAIFLCSALFIGISYFSGGDSSSKKKDNETTSSTKDKSKDKDSLKSKTKEKSDEEKYRENKKHYSYVLDRDSKGKVVVKITEE